MLGSIFSKIISRKNIERFLVIFVVMLVTAVVVRAADRKISDKQVEDLQDGCPTDMVFVPGGNGGFCMDKYESSASSKCPYNSPGSQDETRVNLDFSGCMPISAPGMKPWTNISQSQAVLACAKAGKRLPSNKEWFDASLGTPDKGSSWGVDDCNVSSNWPMNPGETGRGPNCISATGAYDMIGNVWEWVEGVVRDGKSGETPLPDSGFVKSVDENGLPAETQEEGDPNFYQDYFWMKKTGVRGMARGGYWRNNEEAGQYALYAEIDPGFVGVGIGFRCVK